MPQARLPAVPSFGTADEADTGVTGAKRARSDVYDIE